MHKAKTNNNFTKFISMLLVVLMLVSIVPITASADPASASFENVSGEGKDIISLAEGREYKASIPISADVDPATITWTMVKDSSKSYVSKELFPNQTEGGALSTWICDDGKTPFFNEVKTSVSDSNGHIGFNEPATPYDSYTHTVLLTDKTKQMNAELFGGLENVPDNAVTMGLKTICESKNVILVAFGSEKAEIIHQLVYGKTSTYVPAAMLQMHMNMTLLLDDAAAEKIK